MIKKILCVGLVALSLSACAEESTGNTSTEADDRFVGTASLGKTRIVTDTKTGCNYVFIKTGNAGGLSPLYNNAGEIDCTPQ